MLDIRSPSKTRHAVAALALAACLLVPGYSVQATTNNTGTSNTSAAQGTTPVDMLKKIASGEIPNSNITIAQAQSLLQTLSGGVNTDSIMKVVNSMISGKLTGAQGTALSGIPGLGTENALNSLSNLSNLFGGGNAAESVSKALNAIGITGGQNVEAIIQGAISQNAAPILSGLISQAFPDLAKALGGTQGLMGIISGLLGINGLTLTFGTENPSPGSEGCPCGDFIKQHHESMRIHMTNKRKEHEIWHVTEFFTKHVAPGLMLMAEQLTVVGMQQVQIIGSFFDAKHQLETQRLMQQMTAAAHKDYQPSEGLCTFGTSVRSLASSERAAELAHQAIAARGMQRQLLSGEGVSGTIGSSRALDSASRMKTYIEKFCDKTDNSKTLDDLCKDTKSTAEQRNRDIDYTRTVENKLTLDLDFYTSGNENPSDDETNVFALGANLYAHEVLPNVNHVLLGERGKDLQFEGEMQLMDVRALAAKRSVAQNSFAAITGMKAAGTGEAQPYLYKMVEELGVPEDDLEALLGKNPSYFAQMEILTKKALQNPVFYTELYDKPVNVDRKGAVLQAVGLMQDRDIYKSLIRSESILSVLLETMLAEEQSRVNASINSLNAQRGQPVGGAAKGTP